MPSIRARYDRIPRVPPAAVWVRSAGGTSKWHIAADRRVGKRYGVGGKSEEFVITRCGQILGEVIDTNEAIERRGVPVPPSPRICDDCETILRSLLNSRPF